MKPSVRQFLTADEKTQRRNTAKHRLLQMHFESGVGHIGGNLSALDILLTIYHDVMQETDEFVLSKGHAAGALYVTLWSLGRLADDDLKEFHRDGTLLSGHPPARGIDDILFATGSLGHGLGLASGLALSHRFTGKMARVFCLTSDGEWNEGSAWESLIFARHQNLSNLVVIIDENGLQGFGSTREVADLSPLADKLQAFGLTTIEVDGHDEQALCNAIRTQPIQGPLMVVAKTVKGCGVSFMEHQVDWHYLPLSSEQYAIACREVQSP
jgi:transketolase